MINILSLSKYEGYFSILVKFFLTIPSQFSSLHNKEKIAQSYGYEIEEIDGTSYLTYSTSISYPNDKTKQQIEDDLIVVLNNSQSELNNFTLTDYDEVVGEVYVNGSWK